MPTPTDEQNFKALAAQLSCPSGSNGIEIGHIMNETNIRMTRHSIDRLQLQQEEVVLEIGHGNGAHLSYLLGQQTGIRYHGLEISEVMQHEAQSINTQYITRQQASFGLYNGIDIPFNDDYFDKIFTVNTIYFWKTPELLLAAIYRVLKSKGLFNITFAQKDFMQALPFVKYGFELYDTDTITRLIRATDFRFSEAATQTESIKSKTGEMVDRTFTTVTLVK